MTQHADAFATLSTEHLLELLTPEEKVALTAGQDWWRTRDIKRLGIPAIKTTDGPNGVRGASQLVSTPATCIPSATGLAATWNLDLIYQTGELLARETLAKNASILLAPTCNIQRSPLGGRSFESFSEDPFLSGQLAAAYVNGLQDTGVGACIKHFVCNDQEHERNAVDSVVSERALREIYLMPFMIAQKQAKPWSYMTSYGRIDNVHCSENKRLLQTILRDEWKFDGLVMSDWLGTYSLDLGLKAGLDLEMPAPHPNRHVLVNKMLIAAKLHAHELDARVGAVLDIVKKSVNAHPEIIEVEGEKVLDVEEDRQLNRKIAGEAIVVLKNDANLLPIDVKKYKKIALIGPNMKARVYSGGGSAFLSAAYFVTPHKGITSNIPDDVQVTYNVGCHSHRYLPLLNSELRVEPREDAEVGWVFSFHNKADFSDAGVSRVLRDTRIRLADGLPEGINEHQFYGLVKGFYIPDQSGTYQFSLCILGKAKLFIDDQLVIDLWDQPQWNGTAMYGLACKETFGEVQLEAGRPASIRLEFSSEKPERLGKAISQPILLRAFIQFGGVRKVNDHDAELEASAQAAADADLAIVCAGTSTEWESEGTDRDTLKLPGRIDELISRVAAAQSNTIVINQSGSAVGMPWADEVSTIVQAFFGGNEAGNAIGDVLFGKINPSGKLPLTFPKHDWDIPAHGHYKSENGRVFYSEGLFVGYKWYQQRHIAPRFAFGHGLSYTSFAYSGLKISAPSASLLKDSGTVTVSFNVKNTGSLAGSEVAQLYVSDVESALTRPEKELKGFSKVDLAPGEEKTLKIELDRIAVSFYDDLRAAWRVEAGDFGVYVGGASTDLPLQGLFSLDRTHAGYWTGV